jgi:tRNA acetyltransferase TAN1
MEFDFIATTFRYREDDLIEELEELFKEYSDLSVYISKTNVDGLIVGLGLSNPFEFISFLRNKLKDSPWEIKYLLRFIPIEKVVLTEISKIKEISRFLMNKIPVDTTFKISIEKRHTNLKKIDIINEIAPFVPAKVDLENPSWIILIEIVGRFTGVSVIQNTNLFSSMIEKRNLSNEPF